MQAASASALAFTRAAPCPREHLACTQSFRLLPASDRRRELRIPDRRSRDIVYQSMPEIFRVRGILPCPTATWLSLAEKSVRSFMWMLKRRGPAARIAFTTSVPCANTMTNINAATQAPIHVADGLQHVQWRWPHLVLGPVISGP